jgi:hypothetical protein
VFVARDVRHELISTILAYRSERGTFSPVDELLEVSGIGEPTLHGSPLGALGVCR